MSTKQQIQEFALKSFATELEELNYISGIVAEILQMNGYQSTQGKFTIALRNVNEALKAAKKEISQAEKK